MNNGWGRFEPYTFILIVKFSYQPGYSLLVKYKKTRTMNDKIIEKQLNRMK